MEAIVEPPVPVAAQARSGESGPVTVSAKVRARFVVVYTREYPRIVAYAQRRTGSRQSAEDVAGEVFRIAWEQIAGGVPSTGWLFVTARNLLHAHHRLAQRTALLRHRLELEREQGGDDQSRDAVERVLFALEALPADQRELLTAYYWDDLSGADCAALMGCSVGAVWVRLHRARAALRRHLDTTSKD